MDARALRAASLTTTLFRNLIVLLPSIVPIILVYAAYPTRSWVIDMVLAIDTLVVLGMLIVLIGKGTQFVAIRETRRSN